MRGNILPLPQYAFMAWCSAKARGHLLKSKELYKKQNGDSYFCLFYEPFAEYGAV
jgi:hypothetical protein